MSIIQGGGDDTLAGVSYPPPSFMIGNLKKSKSGSNKRSNIFKCNRSIEKLLYFIDRTYISHGMSIMQGGGEDILAWVSYPPHSFMFMKSKKIQIRF